jgi:hypothetical protein
MIPKNVEVSRLVSYLAFLKFNSVLILKYSNYDRVTFSEISTQWKYLIYFIRDHLHVTTIRYTTLYEGGSRYLMFHNRIRCIL